jgi:hypothetical protein
MHLLPLMHPGQCDLSGRGVVAPGDLAQGGTQAVHVVIGLAASLVQEPMAGRGVGHHNRPELGHDGQQLVLDAALAQRPLLLQGSDRVDGVCAA